MKNNANVLPPIRFIFLKIMYSNYIHFENNYNLFNLYSDEDIFKLCAL